MDHNPANTNTTTRRMMIPRFLPEYSMTSLIMWFCFGYLAVIVVFAEPIT